MRTAGLLVALAIVLHLPTSDALAQRGSQHLNSPGYQRALMESRKPKSERAQPAATLKKKRVRRSPED